jgi:hypothetical protein
LKALDNESLAIEKKASQDNILIDLYGQHQQGAPFAHSWIPSFPRRCLYQPVHQARRVLGIAPVETTLFHPQQ